MNHAGEIAPLVKLVRPHVADHHHGGGGASRILRFGRRSPTPRPRSSPVWSRAAPPCSIATIRTTSLVSLARSGRRAHRYLRLRRSAERRAERVDAGLTAGGGRRSCIGDRAYRPTARRAGPHHGAERARRPCRARQPSARRHQGGGRRSRDARRTGRARRDASCSVRRGRRIAADRRKLQRQPRLDARGAATSPRSSLAREWQRRIVVLGDMLELGRQRPELHRGAAPSSTRPMSMCLCRCGQDDAGLYDALPACAPRRLRKTALDPSLLARTCEPAMY